MKKWLLGMMAAVMAVSLAACTPTTGKQKEETTTVSAENPEPAVVPTTGGASDKVPDPNVEPVAVISIYHKGDGDSLVQEMDSLDDDDLNAQALVDRMIGYGVFTEGTEVISFDKTGEEENAKGVLNLNQAKNNEGVTETQFLVEIGNTFIENFELSTLTVQINGQDMEGASALEYQAKNNEGVTETQFLVEIGNTFIENFELSTLTVQINGQDMEGASALEYVTAFEDVE